jgi:L-2-hydroxycarboxylate dehydrogenase (NAD+)
MRVKISEVHDVLLRVVVAKSSLSTDDADILISDYIEGEMESKKSHGLAAFPALMEKLPIARADYKVLRETDSFLYVDAEGSFGAIVGRRVADALIEKAKTQGLAFAVIREMKAWLRPGTIAQYVADHNMLALVVNTGGPPMISPPGGKEPVVGTNPIGIGVPATDNPLVVDMATSTRAWGEVRLAKRFNHELPPNAFLDKEGVVTREADAAYSVLPMGGYKGFGLSFFIEILGGSLANMTMGKGDVNEAYHVRNRGADILVINPEMTVSTDAFKKQNRKFIDSISQSPAAKGSSGVTLPGDRATRNKQQSVANGYLEIEKGLWDEITSLLDG